MGYEWIPAAVSAAASGTAGILAATKKRGTTRMVKMAKELAEYNNSLAVKNWQMENEYNSPAAQMQRYQEAGLNPNLIYSQQNTGGSIAGGSVDTNPEHYQGESKAAEALQGVANGISTYQQLRSQQISNSNANLAGDLTRENIEGKRLENDYNRESKSYKLEELALSVQNQRFQAYEKNQRELENLLEDIQQKKANTKKILSDTDLNEARKKNLERQTSHYDTMEDAIRSTIQVNDARIQDMAHQAQNRSAMLSLGWANYGLNKGRFDFEKEKYGDLAGMRQYQEIGTAFDAALKAKAYNYYDYSKYIDFQNRIYGNSVQSLPNVFLKMLDSLLYGKDNYGREMPPMFGK